MGGHIRSLNLDKSQRDELERLARRQSTPQSLALRVRIVVMTADAGAAGEIARKLGTTRATVRKWKERFLKYGMDGLSDMERPGAPSKYRLEDKLRVLSAAGVKFGSRPDVARRPSIRAIANDLKLDRGFVLRVLCEAKKDGNCHP